MTTNNARVQSGLPEGGQFTTATRTEPGVDLVQERTGERCRVLAGAADDLFYDAAPDEQSLATARDEARTVLESLDEQDFVDRWADILEAARQHAVFADEQQGFALVVGGELTTEQACGVELEDFTEINTSYQPGQDGYLGYDFRGYADAIADAWGQARYVRVLDAVRADARVRARQVHEAGG